MRVFKKLEKRVKWFDGGGNVSVSHPSIYEDDEEGASKVLVHGTSQGFETLNSYINDQLYPYGGEYVAEDGTKGMRIYGDCGFAAYVFPPNQEEQDFINKSKMKIEMVVVANIVPTMPTIYYDPDSSVWIANTHLYGSAAEAIVRYKQRYLPYRVTMMYALYF